jgi:hypothetical protein
MPTHSTAFDREPSKLGCVIDKAIKTIRDVIKKTGYWESTDFFSLHRGV